LTEVSRLYSKFLADINVFFSGGKNKFADKLAALKDFQKKSIHPEIINLAEYYVLCIFSGA
jgi:hypothetical protein